jgi:hypothetical protein
MPILFLHISTSTLGQPMNFKKSCVYALGRSGKFKVPNRSGRFVPPITYPNFVTNSPVSYVDPTQNAQIHCVYNIYSVRLPIISVALAVKETCKDCGISFGRYPNRHSKFLPPPPHVALRPNAAPSLLILEVSRSHTTTHHSR